MLSPPTVIISLDCEGKWGMADLDPPYFRDLTSASLSVAYRQLLAMFARYEVAATFAFVMAFTLSAAEREQFPVLDRWGDPDDAWLAHYWRSLDEGQAEGWHEPEPFALVRDSGRHEIAAHGFCHRSLGEAAIDQAGATRELADAARAAQLKGVELKTLVFPRNEVGHLPAVAAAGYLGYRARLDRPSGIFGRGVALLDELAVNAAPQQPLQSTAGLVAIPAGHFFNWRFGMRRLVPPAVTKARWRNQLRKCVRDGGVVHLWLHPHNLITGPSTAPVLESVLAEIARLRDRGQVAVMTQQRYCEHMLAATG